MAKQQFSIRDCASIFGNTVIGGSSLTEGASARLHVKSAASEGANLSNTSGLLIETSGTCSTSDAITIATCCGNVFGLTQSGTLSSGVGNFTGSLSSTTGDFTTSLSATSLSSIDGYFTGTG